MSNLRWNIGEVEIQQIFEIEAGSLIQSTFKEATPENIKKIGWLVPDFADSEGNLKAQCQSFLVKSNRKNILVDSCNGNDKNRPGIPEWTNLKVDFLGRLRETDIREEEIDLVVFSHLHCDHVGWNTKLKDGKWVPTFPNAKYLFVKEDYDYWKSKPEKEFEDDKLAFDDSVWPIVEAGLAEFVETDYEIDENFKLIPSPGHTPGHMSFAIESNGEKAMISGDFIHHPCQFEHPEWTMDVDFSSEQSIETRLKILNELADTDTLLIGSHFADPVAGRVVKKGNSFILKT